MQRKINETNQRNGISFPFVIVSMGVFLILATMLAPRFLRYRPGNQKLDQQVRYLLHFDTETSKYILKSSLPALELTAEEDDPLTLFHTNWADIYWRLAADVRSTSPLGILQTQFPLAALYKPIQKPEIARVPLTPETTPQPSPESQTPNSATPELSGDPAVLIYHTHTTESYIPSSGKDHLVNQKGDVVKVGSYLQEVLEQKYHIKCVHSDTIHDQYPFRDSYKRAHVTVVNYLKKYPSIKVVIDLHRDATPGLPNSCVINGAKCATIAFIVGSDKMKLPHPHWKVNQAFAKELNETMQVNYPDLSNGIIVSDARYNQHLHTHAILVEFGDQDSTLEEAYHAVDYFAAVLNTVLSKDPFGETTLSQDD